MRAVDAGAPVKMSPVILAAQNEAKTSIRIGGFIILLGVYRETDYTGSGVQFAICLQEL